MSEPLTSPASSRVLRAAVWIAIGALIAAALVCVVWVLVGDADGIVGKAFLTILLLAAFAGIAVLESHLATRRPAWFALASMVAWVLTLLLGAVFIWMPYGASGYGEGAERFFRFLLVVLVVQLALLHVRLYIKAFERHRTTFTAIVTYATIGLVVILTVMLVLPLTLGDAVTFLTFYWRVVVALAILAAVGTALVPLVNALFAPRRPRPPRPTAPALPAWPTYADGRTALPMLPDGSPDWNAYYTGQPTYPHGFLAPGTAAAAPQAPSAPSGTWAAPSTPPVASHPAPPAPAPGVPPAPTGYEGYPPPPPAPR